ncbi:Metallo-beta-lactamase superfamily protein [Clostridium sp. DSM 8431]|uniref:ComEC/Rec2 family competence protein n=1 Tax=Clostridium sp. DSM 8431 TaxID=1761781 RepID=UPI0008E691A5|nr:MBL fold metallo-hydrolase [Clostridium sp. DSM 8431]SFU35313.1 Metallo-beta-lactamase superfamily protein [Clostridium sp. DSM 8431]
MKRMFRYIAAFFILSFALTGCTNSQLNSKIISETSNGDFSICFINSGKSDSILVMYEGKSYLIDTGTKDSVDAIKKALEANNVESLDGVFLTHTHKDHIGGLKKLSKEYNIPIVYSAEISMNKEEGTNAIDSLVDNELNLKHEKLKAGDKINITDDVYFEVLGPITYNSDDDNDNSLVLRINVNGKTVLLTGDMQFAEEVSLMDSGVDVKADILKVGNHGNKDATSKEFAEAVDPSIAVITTDREEDSGTASKRVRKLFEETNLYITDDYDVGLLVTITKSGEIEVTSK